MPTIKKQKLLLATMLLCSYVLLFFCKKDEEPQTNYEVKYKISTDQLHAFTALSNNQTARETTS
jgi:hypothetical protein